MVFCAGKWVAGASSCTTAHLGWWGPVQGQPLTKFYLSHTHWTLIIIIIIIIIITTTIIITIINLVTFMQGIYNYMSETNRVCRVWSVAAVLY